MEVLSKSIIEKWIVPYLSVGKRGAKPQVALSDVVSAILHRLKTGEQWRWLPLKEFFAPGAITWNGVYYYFNKWFKDGSFQNAWMAILQANKACLDLSSLQLDGSHTPAKQLVIRVERRLQPPLRCSLPTTKAYLSLWQIHRLVITMMCMRLNPCLNRCASCWKMQAYR